MKEIIQFNNIEQFMTIFMCELELYLLSNIDDLKKISFQLDEANTDRPLKEYLKNVIETRCNSIKDLSGIKTIQYLNEIKSWCVITDDIKSVFVNRVLLPDEITDDIKDILRTRKAATFTNPDLCLELNVQGKLLYETVELKSTKDNSIPGSSVQQVSPYEWVIFIKHNNNNIDVATGRYINAINSRLQFPDRSPRPQVSFNELKEWNIENRHICDDSISFKSRNDEKLKEKLLTDWQSVLAERWISIVFNDEKRKNEPWFNNNIRKFVVLFLNEYEKLSESDKCLYIAKLNDLID